MKKSLFLTTILGSILCANSFGQGAANGTLNNYMMVEPKFNKPGVDAEGSPYITDDLMIGYVIFRNDYKLNDVSIRYNGFENLLEMKLKDVTYISKASDLKEFGYIDPKSKKPVVYKYLPLDDNTSSMLEILFEDKIIFGCHNRIKVRYGVRNDLNPGKDVLQNTLFYYLIKDGQSKKITRSNKSLVQELADHATELNKYIKDNKLNAKDDNDLSEILKFYISLTDQSQN